MTTVQHAEGNLITLIISDIVFNNFEFEVR